MHALLPATASISAGPAAHGTVLGVASPAAGGAALDQVILASGFAVILLGALALVVKRGRSGKPFFLDRLADRLGDLGGLPGWAALPAVVLTGSLLVALFGMYWDISLHIDHGRDPGPLANPAHYFILFGLFGILAAGTLSAALAREPLPASSLRLPRGWRIPLGSALVIGCASFSLLGFPLDDAWHRMFGQDVTLFGPTHLMLIGGATLSTIAGWLMLLEGARAAGGTGRFLRSREVFAAGGVLIGLSTFQAEFDFGVPQFRFALEPVMVAVAAGIALVAARMRIGRGGALAATAFFLVVRGALTLLVGGLLGRTLPHFTLYIASALVVELVVGLMGTRRPLLTGAVAGLGIGTAGIAAEFGWSRAFARLPWPTALWPSAFGYALLAAIGAGIIGAWLAMRLTAAATLTIEPYDATRQPALLAAAQGSRLRSLLPAAGLVAMLAALVITVPVSATRHVTADVTLHMRTPIPYQTADATIRLSPAHAADHVEWFTATSWQGGSSQVERLVRIAPGVYRSTKPLPLYGNWKTTLRLQSGRDVLGLGVFLPRDDAIPAPEVRALPHFTRTFELDKKLLQREQKPGVPQWLTLAAYLAVLAIAVVAVTALAAGLVLAGRSEQPPGRDGGPRSPRRTRTFRTSQLRTAD
jgi:hypothetical protein